LKTKDGSAFLLRKMRRIVELGRRKDMCHFRKNIGKRDTSEAGAVC
jgi:hypothetical protein